MSLGDVTQKNLANAKTQDARGQSTQRGQAVPRPWILLDDFEPHYLCIRGGVDENWPRGGNTICRVKEGKTGAKRGESPRWVGFSERDRANFALIVAAVNAYQGSEVPTLQRATDKLPKEEEEKEGGEAGTQRTRELSSEQTGNAPYAFNDHQMYAVLEGAIGMFFEYRDQHGKDEDAAKHAAIQEIIEGLDAERELFANGEKFGRPTQQLVSLTSTRSTQPVDAGEKEKSSAVCEQRPSGAERGEG